MILDERPLGPFDVADILLGAIDARLRLRGQRAGLHEGRGFTMSLRIGGIAAILGGTLWAVGILIASETVVQLGRTAPATLFLAGTAAMLVALAGLSAFQARTHAILAWVAFLVPAAGMTTIVVSFTEALGESSWNLFAVGMVMAWVGFLLFTIVTYLTGVLPRAAAALVGVGITMPAAYAAVTAATATDFGASVSSVVAVATGAFVLLGWFTLGAAAIRLDRPATEATPA
jgi:hypothetical protein